MHTLYTLTHPAMIRALMIVEDDANHSDGNRRQDQQDGWNLPADWHRQRRSNDTSQPRGCSFLSSMKDAGYIYVNIDDSWQGDRDANGLLHTGFPRGGQKESELLMADWEW
jgi:hypothetical protein